MTIKEFLPQLENLSRNEKLQVIKFLVEDLETEELENENLIISESLFLSQKDWERVTELIANPPQQNLELFSAFERYTKEVKIR